VSAHVVFGAAVQVRKPLESGTFLVERGLSMRERSGLWLWPLLATTRLRDGVREHWKRILVGAFVGWLLAVVGGAVALALLEIHHVISHATSDDLGIIIVLYGVGIGALNAYTFRPRATVPVEGSTTTRLPGQ
jgi:hypothetical protein